MRRAVPILLILWAAVGVTWALLRDEPIASQEAGAPTEATPPQAAKLETHGTHRRPAHAARADVPDAILRSTGRLHVPEEQTRFFAWLDEDPARILALLQAWAHPGPPADPRGPDAGPRARDLFLAGVARRARNLFSRFRPRLRGCIEHLIAALDEANDDDAYRAALLGAVTGAGAGGPDARRIAARLVRDAERSLGVRQLAAEILLWASATEEDKGAAFRVALEGDDLVSMSLLRRVLAALQAHGAAASPWLQAVLDFQARVKGSTWADLEALQTLLAIAPEDPRVRERLTEAVGRSDGRVARFARTWLFQGDVEEALRYLETAPATARIEGVMALFQRGVAKDRLAPHVLMALSSGGFDVRTRAVQLLGKLGCDVAEVLPIIDGHLASDDKGRWLTGVQTLGALATVPGDKRVAVERLLEVGRRPDVRVRTAAVQAILMHDAQPAPVIEFLAYLLDDGDAAVRAEAVDGLGELSAQHPSARQALERARTDTSAEVREVVAYWLEDDD